MRLVNADKAVVAEGVFVKLEGTAHQLLLAIGKEKLREVVVGLATDDVAYLHHVEAVKAGKHQLLLLFVDGVDVFNDDLVV